jgi:transcriptional regulator NrdR family protein
MVMVKKRSGKLEEFNSHKIVSSCTKAGASLESANEVAETVSKKVYEKIPTSKIRTMILSELTKHSKSAAEKFKKFKRK